jgi:hypothetical protein
MSGRRSLARDRATRRERRPRPAAAAARTIALALALLGLAAAPIAANARPHESPWISLGLLTGSTEADRGLANYQWRISPGASWGAQVLAGLGRFAAGARVWTAASVQTVEAPGVTMSPRVRWTSAELVARARAARALGLDCDLTASGGRMRLAYSPDRLTFDPGTGPVTVDFRPVDEWIAGLGFALGRPLAAGWTAGLEADHRFFSLDTAHRNGAAIDYSRQSFGDWNVRLELARRWGRR